MACPRVAHLQHDRTFAPVMVIDSDAPATEDGPAYKRLDTCSDCTQVDNCVGQQVFESPALYDDEEEQEDGLPHST
jgi:hypothetical protein